ncbi:hypothetical protein [Paenibacillus sp. MMS20-IR301]|uniref:hypothetical protein n=1 Tax=Paenibacillus sp. MMS20-IR301 TaxID=2895946 RepID=UPI0028E5A651|nr:hypothetical protein [Paenibacillus sp. MMS20-IR301]WNS44951.1 hypothetical protein LOS79_06680 [Paenibacillus sp. MMS20-IR301]
MNNQDEICLAQFLFPDEAERAAAAGLLQTAPAAERICRIKYAEGEQFQDVCLQVFCDRTVVTGMDKEDGYSYVLEEPGQIKRAFRYLFNCSEYAEGRSLAVPALVLSGYTVQKLLDESGTCSLIILAELLGAETGDPLSAAKLAATLHSRVITGVVWLCTRSVSSWCLQQAAFVEGSAGGWLLRGGCERAQDFITACPFTRAEMCQALYDWIVLPGASRHPE